eukprot:1160293-Pelagomonas_calceolata.AAC.9
METSWWWWLHHSSEAWQRGNELLSQPAGLASTPSVCCNKVSRARIGSAAHTSYVPAYASCCIPCIKLHSMHHAGNEVVCCIEGDDGMRLFAA